MIGLLSLALISITTFASVENSSIVKTLDGKVAYCNDERKIGNHAYLPTSFAVTMNDDVISLKLEVAALKCEKIGNNFQWISRAFNASLNKISLDGTPFTINVSNLGFMLVDSNYKNLGFVSIGSDRSKEILFNVGVQNTMNESELSKLNLGEAVRVQWSFFLRGLKSVTMNGKTDLLGQFTGGFYSVTFDVVKKSEGLTLQNINLK